MASDYLTETCPHCGNLHGGVCPRVKIIEYFPNGTIRRVEYHGTNGDLKIHRWPWAKEEGRDDE